MSATDYVNAVLADTPRWFLKLQDASGNPVDSSGNGFNCTAIGGGVTYRAAGPMSDFGIEFPGGNSASTATLVTTATNDITMECFYRYIAGSTDYVMRVGNLAANGFAMYVDASKKMVALLGGVGSQAQSAVTFATGGFYHLVIVRDSTNSNRWTYYVNGVVDTANAGTSAPNAPSGGTSLVGAPDGNMQERLAYVAIYQSALSSARVAAHYAAAFASDPGGASGIAPAIRALM